MAGSLAAVGAVYYVVQVTANDGDLLDLDNIELSQSSLVVATDPDTGAQVEYATLRSSNSHRVWADLEQIPTNLQYAFICTEDKDFYSEPGVNFKRTIGAMINEYLLPIYSSKQGASTLEQQLIKNLTSDKSASGIEGALRKLREIYPLSLHDALPIWAGPSSPSSVWALWRAVWWQWALYTMWCRLRPVTATCWTSTTSS